LAAGVTGVNCPSVPVTDFPDRHHKTMEKRIACNDVVPGCEFTATAATEEELLKKVVEHASHVHGVTDVTPELAARVKSAIKDDDHA
jgi:predicted small metal-binding protein